MKKGALFTTIGSVIILIISFIAFVLPSQLSSGVQSSKKVFGKYKSREIVYEKDSDLINNLQAAQNNFMQTYGREPENNEFYSLFYGAFKDTVAQYAYEEAAKKAGYLVSEETVNRQLRSYFEDENGKFSNDLYNQADPSTIVALKESFLNGGYYSRVGQDLFGSQSELIGDASLYGLKESDAELDFISSFDTNKRAFNMVTFKKSEYPDEQVMDFAQKNQNIFTKYNMSIITFDDKTLADKIAKNISEGKTTFEDASTEGTNKFSDAENKLVYPYYYQYRIEKMLNDASDVAKLSSLATSSVSDVIELTDGYAIFRKDGDATKADFSDETTFRDVRTYISTYEGPTIEDYYIAKAKEFKAEAEKTSFDAACTKLGLVKTDVPAFALNYNGSTFATSVNSSLPGLKFADTNENFLKTAFSLKENQIGDPMVMIDDASTGYVIVIQYIATENNDDTDTDMKPFLAYQISNYDSMAAANKIMSGKNVKDSFNQAYYGY